LIISIFILFVSALLGGIIQFIVPRFNSSGYHLSLVFAGSYLFSITIVHLIPELYLSSYNRLLTGTWILVGFFFQQVLEYFSSGVEHGHIHHHHHKHGISTSAALIALSIHAYLEGTLISNPVNQTLGENDYALIAGIVLHKIPAAYALMAITGTLFGNRWKTVIVLLVFALASPAGLLTGEYLTSDNLVSESAFVILYALVSGSFLHISTTIVFESSPEHTLKFKRILVALLGASFAILSAL